MLLAFVIVILMVMIGVLASMNSIFMPFLENLSDVQEFNVAYYAALSSAERGLLVSKFKDEGFEGSGGWLDTAQYGPDSDLLDVDFGRMTYPGNGMWWNITSRTSRIPSSGGGNVEYLLAADDSINYNTLQYNTKEAFVLHVDDTTDITKYYTQTAPTDITRYGGNYINAHLRLPPKILSGFGEYPELCDCAIGGNGYFSNYPNCDPSCDPNNDRVHDEVVIDWTFEGTYSPIPMFFKIIPNISVSYQDTPALVDLLNDVAIREDVINAGNSMDPNITFGNSYTPIADRIIPLDQHQVIAYDSSFIEGSPFSTLISDGAIDDLQLQIGLVNLLRAQNGNIYPFLEYKFEFSEPIADRFYHILGNGRIGDYDVKILINKPTVKESVVGDFTVIF